MLTWGFETERWQSGRRPSWWTQEMEANAERLGLSETSIIANNLNIQMGVVHFDNLYYQYNQGLLDEGFLAKHSGCN